MNETLIALIARMSGAALLPLLIGWGVAFSQKRTEKSDRLPKKPLIIGALIAAVLAGNSMFRQLSENAEHTVQVIRQEEPAPNATEADITTNYLDRVAAESVAQLGNDVPESPTTTSTTVIEQNGKRLGIIRFKTGNVTPMIAVLGLGNGSVIRVFCVQGDLLGNLANVDVRSPKCSQALMSAFGVVPEL